MNKLKSFALAAVVVAAFVAFAAASASATELYTEPAGGSEESNGMVASGTSITASAEGTTTLHPPIGDITCEESGVSGKTENTGSATETVKAPVSSLTFSKCNAEVVVLKTGSLEIHTRETKATGNGTLTSTGAEVTVTFAGFHCIFTTSSTDIGTLTGSTATESNATLDIEATIPRTGGRSGAFCGSTAKWTGSYKVTSPAVLGVDVVCRKFAATFGRYTTPGNCIDTVNEEPELGSWRRYPK